MAERQRHSLPHERVRIDCRGENIALVIKIGDTGNVSPVLLVSSCGNFPEAIMLRRVLKLKLIAIFFGITTLGIIITGYLFNLLQKILV